MKPLQLLHIVRRYGPVGGMERYVWELTRELAAMGHDVRILCTRRESETPAGVEVVTLGEVAEKPRWLAHMRFSHRVSEWVRRHPAPERIIHSHERTGVHHVTTFHGPPFVHVLEKAWWQRISLRVRANLWLEKREVCGPQVRAVIPNSAVIATSLKHFYPCIGPRLQKPISPGVSEGPVRPDRMVLGNGGVIGFIGKEWRRKGLDIAVRIVRELRRQRPALKFLVAGADPAEISPLFTDGENGYQLLGEIDTTAFYPQLDLLLHPARHEPYGMVIAEAMAARVPVLMSDRCGAAADAPAYMALPLDADIRLWAERCHELIGAHPASFRRSWKDVARKQVQCYKAIHAGADHPASNRRKTS
ncbi:MAG: glycosyltransferase family 4 protein [Mariprofundaceae bacterium]|nr:glycosyltransferase family 4 protein [Mariprofundaceae bacterium]